MKLKETSEKIKKEIQEFLDLCEAADPGPWTYNWPNWTDDYVHPDYELCGEDCPPICEVSNSVSNALYIAKSRSISPKIAKMLLISIIALENECDEFKFPDEDRPICFHALEEICRGWEESEC